MHEQPEMVAAKFALSTNRAGSSLLTVVRHMCAQAHFNLGNVYRQMGIFEAAVHCYGMLLELAPGHWRALLNLSVALAGLGRNHEAHKALRASFKASGNLSLSTPVFFVHTKHGFQARVSNGPAGLVRSGMSNCSSFGSHIETLPCILH